MQVFLPGRQSFLSMFTCCRGWCPCLPLVHLCQIRRTRERVRACCSPIWDRGLWEIDCYDFVGVYSRPKWTIHRTYCNLITFLGSAPLDKSGGKVTRKCTKPSPPRCAGIGQLARVHIFHRLQLVCSSSPNYRCARPKQIYQFP